MLYSAIAGNRRDSRSIQSPLSFPILNPGGAFGMPLHPGVFGFQGMPGVHPMGFQSIQHGMLQTAKNITTSGELKSPNFASPFKYC